MSEPLSSLEKFGILSRKFLHDTSNDFTAISLNLHFIENSIAPDHPAYKDFHNLARALKSLQQNTRTLSSWRRQLPDPLVSLPVGELLSHLPGVEGWDVQSNVDVKTQKTLRIYSPWIDALVQFLAPGKQGILRYGIIASPNDQCSTAEQVNLTFEPVTACNYEQLREIDLSLNRELAKLMGGGIVFDSNSAKSRATLFLPVYS